MSDTQRADDIRGIAKIVTEYFEPRIIEVTPATYGEADKVPVLILPTGMTAHDYRPLVEAYRGHPDRRRGTASIEDLESFIAHSLRHKDTNSAIFADPTRAAPKLTTIFNYNLSGEELIGDVSVARFGDHRAVYAPKLSDEYKAWSEKNATKMTQADFADFVEDRITDIAPPPEFDGEQASYNKFLKEFSDLVGGNFASPSRMMELSRGIHINADAKVKQVVNLSSGEGQIQYEETHRDSAGAPVKVPNLFMLAIPIFYNGPLYRIPVRLRYRVGAGSLTWWFEIYRIDRAFDSAFEEMCETARTRTELALFVGKPEV